MTDGGPAFPGPFAVENEDGTLEAIYASPGGMKLRDYFAGQALCIPLKFPLDVVQQRPVEQGVVGPVLPGEEHHPVHGAFPGIVQPAGQPGQRCFVPFRLLQPPVGALVALGGRCAVHRGRWRRCSGKLRFLFQLAGRVLAARRR